MKLTSTIEALRERIDCGQKSGQNWPIVSLGDSEMDRGLPVGGLATGALYEMFPDSYADFPATVGFGLGLVSRLLQKRNGALIWVQPDYGPFAETPLYPLGLAAFGIDPDRLIHVTVPKAQNVLWALDEALAQPGVAAAVGLMPEDERCYDFTATRRLGMRATSRGSTAFLFLREPGFAMATAAEMRWSVTCAVSSPVHHIGQKMPYPGRPRWHVRLTKTRGRTAGDWEIEWDHETLSFRLAAPLAGRAPQRISGIGARQSAAA